jgi:hypothetical protein
VGKLLADAAAVLGSHRFHDAVEELSAAASTLSGRAMDARISRLHDAAETLSDASGRIGRYRGDW